MKSFTSLKKSFGIIFHYLAALSTRTKTLVLKVAGATSRRDRNLYAKQLIGGRNAFGIIEVLISGVIVITVIAAAASVRQRANSQSAFSRHQAVGYLLAQEGIEAVRQIRETNYITKMRDTTGALVRIPWNCGISHPISISVVGAGPDHDIGSCDQTAQLTQNGGSFSSVNAAGAGTLELGNGMQASSVFLEQENEGVAHAKLPSWHLSSPGVFDGGSNNGSTTLSHNMLADGCLGIERIFVREGALTASGGVSTVRENRRNPGDADNTHQDNIPGPIPNPGVSCTNPIPAGFMEYKRQVLTSSVNNIVGDDDNIPSLWTATNALSPTAEHIVRVIVRVSWEEPNRVTGPDSDNAVMLATYLTDWRPQ